jgi:hypothetical protein
MDQTPSSFKCRGGAATRDTIAAGIDNAPARLLRFRPGFRLAKPSAGNHRHPADTFGHAEANFEKNAEKLPGER